MGTKMNDKIETLLRQEAMLIEEINKVKLVRDTVKTPELKNILTRVISRLEEIEAQLSYELTDLVTDEILEKVFKWSNNQRW